MTLLPTQQPQSLLSGVNLTISKAYRGSVEMARNGADRRVGGIGPKCASERKWPDSAHAAIGTVFGQF